MSSKSIGLALLCAAAVTLASSQTLAQTRPAAAPAAAAARPPIPTGPAIPGLCVLNREQLLYTAVVGKYVDQRLHQLKAQSDAELNGEAQGIKADETTLQTQKASLPQDQIDQRVAGINARIGAFQAKVQHRDAEMQKTLEKAVSRINQEAEPFVQQAFTQHNCSILLNADGVLFSAKSMDITEQVVVGLNGKITQFPFDRELIVDQPGAPAGQ